MAFYGGPWGVTGCAGPVAVATGPAWVPCGGVWPGPSFGLQPTGPYAPQGSPGVGAGCTGFLGPTGPQGPVRRAGLPPEHRLTLRLRSPRDLRPLLRHAAFRGHRFQVTGRVAVCDLCLCSVTVDPGPRGLAPKDFRAVRRMPSCPSLRDALVRAVADR